MKNLMLFCIGVFSTTLLTAQVDGPLSGVTFGNAPLAGSSQVWMNVGNAANSDNVYANFPNLVGTGSHTDYLTVTNFSFSVPVGATINGIVVEIERSDPNFRTSDYSIRIIKNGVIGSDEHSGGATYPFSDSYQTYGNPADLWNDTWTDADVNAVNFGVAIAARRNSAGGITGGKVDHVRITIFYDFITLPLKLLSFSLQKNQNSVSLFWVTAEETHMDHFEVERSADGINFTSIGAVANKNLPVQTSYTFDDLQPLNDVSYYRLKMVSDNGSAKYSKIISVQFTNSNSARFYPNPWRAGTPLNIVNAGSQKLTIRFFNATGQLLGRATTNTTQVSPGIFFQYHGWMMYQVYDEKNKLYAAGKLLVQ